MKISRQSFIRNSILTSAGFLFAGTGKSLAQQAQVPAPLKPELVKEFVRVCHSNFDKVKEMLENEHLLLHASWDLGGGDFEAGLEAASHVGNKEIASYLLSRGARYNLFTASMFGHIEIVKQALVLNPQLLNAKGPHGLTLLHHAIKGKEESAALVEHLKSLGAVETKIKFYEKA
jgi:hypothetical protein